MKIQHSFWFLAAIAIIPLVYSNETIDPAFTLRAILLAILALVTIFVARKQPLRTSPLLWIWCAYAGFNILSIFVAQNSGEAIYEASLTLLYGAWLFAALQMMRKEFLLLVLRTIALLGFVISFISLFQFFDIGFGFIPSWGLPGATMTTKNLMSSFLFLTLPATLYIAITEKRAWSVFSLISITMSVFVLLIAQTRAVWLGCAAAAFIASALFVLTFQRKNLWKAYRTGIFKTAIAIVSCILAIFVLNIATRTGPNETSTAERVGTIANYASDASAEARLNVWQESIEMFQDHPVLGVGPGNWKIWLPRYGLSKFPTTIQNGSIQWTETHNDFLEAFCETGIGGGLAFLFVFLFGIYLAIRSAHRTSNSSRETILAILIAACICGFGIVSFFDFPNARAEHSMLFILWLAMLPMSTGRANGSNQFSRYLALALVLPALLLSIQRFRAEHHERKLLEARLDHNWSEVISEFSQIYDSRSLTVDALATPLFYYKAEAEFMQQDYNAALRDNLEALNADPNHFFTLNNIGSCYVKLGNVSTGKVFLKKALAISPNFEESLLNLATVYFNQNKWDSAYEYVRKCDTSQEGSRAQKIARALRGTRR